MQKKSIKFLCWLAENFGYRVAHISYRDLGKEYQMSYETIRLYVSALEKQNYLTIEKVSPRKQTLYLNVERVKQLLDE